MAQRSLPTNAVHRAHGRITRAVERAQKNLADIPLGKEKVDPRTAKRHAPDRNLELELHRIHKQNQTSLPYNETMMRGTGIPLNNSVNMVAGGTTTADGGNLGMIE